MTNLYAALGVDKSATRAQVHRAYRKMAKKAHPDGGGTAERFALVKLAHDILSDDERRARYDATSDTSEEAVDNAQAEAANFIMSAIQQVLATIEQRGRNPSEYDVLGDTRKIIDAHIATQEQNITNAKRAADEHRKLAKRFKAKKGKVNRISPMLESTASEAERAAVAMRQNLDKLKLAYDMLGEHNFDFSAPQNFTTTGPARQQGFLSGSM